MSKEKKQFLKENANFIASYCAAVTSILMIVLLAMKLFVELPLLIVLAFCAVSFPLLVLMIYALQIKPPELPEYLSDSTATYVISRLSIQTLRVAKVPRDITDFLAEPLIENGKISPFKKTVIKKRAGKDVEFDKYLKLSKENNCGIILKEFNQWLTELNNDLGKIRVDEYLETILKYTRRDAEMSSFFNTSGFRELPDTAEQKSDKTAGNGANYIPAGSQN
ncbi:MAG TPA: hypothetical protein VF648_04105 [Pyrinomonadaceae bacterium]|jgi:predicted ABC-type exoprotein transport system permease subunit